MILSANTIERLNAYHEVSIWLPDVQAQQLKVGQRVDLDNMDLEVVEIGKVATFTTQMRRLSVKKWGT